MENEPQNTDPLLQPSDQEEQKANTVISKCSVQLPNPQQPEQLEKLKKFTNGAEIIETQLKDPELGTKIKQGTVDSLQWTKEKIIQAKDTVQDPEFKEKLKKTVETTGQSVKVGVDVLWEDLKKGATTLKKEFIPGEKNEEDENKKRVFDTEGTPAPVAPLQNQMYESMDPPKIEVISGYNMFFVSKKMWQRMINCSIHLLKNDEILISLKSIFVLIKNIKKYFSPNSVLKKVVFDQSIIKQNNQFLITKMFDQIFEEADISVIFPPNKEEKIGGLFLGSQITIQNELIQKILNIKCVISLLDSNFGRASNECNNLKLSQNDSMIIEVNDSEDDNLEQYFLSVFEFIEAKRALNFNILIIAYLMLKYDWNVKEAFTFLEKKRPAINPNYNFINQLEEFQKKIGDGLLDQSQQNFYSLNSLDSV